MGERGADRGLPRRLTAALRLGVDALAAVVLAPSCAACGDLLEQPTLGAVCERCWHSILPLTPPLCDRCGDPLPSATRDDRTWCTACRGERHAVDRMRSIGAYDGALRAIVHALKYDERRSLARRLAMLMRERGSDMLAGAACAVPVPLHPSRRRHRGFNQANDLARHLGAPMVHALARVRATAAQTELSAAERQSNVRGAFAATRHARGLEGAVVVLVDDVSTTGATLEACAGALKAIGVREVRALTAARVVTPR